jgi:hypothetical protein
MVSISTRHILAFGLTLPMALLVFMVGLTKSSFEVNPEYMDGILAANGVIFGFWAAIIGLNIYAIKQYKKTLETFFFTTLSLLVFCVFLLSGTALGFLPSVWTLYFSVLFYLTCVFLGLTLYYIVFK